jgi:2-(1,2-epoxy-1,2-dihydrophenyl)acetyl-CoA isomerase
MSEYEFIDYTRDGDVAVVLLNNPAALNALSQHMGQELNDALDRAGSEARAVVLGSHGRAFSAGANLTAGDIDISDPDRDIGQFLDTVFNPSCATCPFRWSRPSAARPPASAARSR